MYKLLYSAYTCERNIYIKDRINIVRNENSLLVIRIKTFSKCTNCVVQLNRYTL